MALSEEERAAGVRAELLRFQETGNPDALGAVYDHTAPELFRLALRLAPNAVSAEDAIQETFLTVVEITKSYDPSRPPLPWLVGILKLKIREVRRRAARRPDPLRLESRLLPRDPEGEAERSEARERIREALEDLPEPYRGVALLRWRYGLEPAEIAHVRGQPPGTVSSILSRALAKIRKRIPGLALLLPQVPAARGLKAVRAAILKKAAQAGRPITVLTGSGLIGGIVMAKKGGVLAAAIVLAVGIGVGLRELTVEREPGPAAPGEARAERTGGDSGTNVQRSSPTTGSGVLTGRLVRGLSRTPVPGTVEISISDNASVRVEAGPHGRFRTEGLPIGEPLELQAVSPGLLPGVISGVELPPGGTLDLGDVVLGGPCIVEIRVFDRTGSPMSAVEVSLHARPHRSAVVQTSLPKPVVERKTDDLGRVALLNVPPGWWVLRARKEGYAVWSTSLGVHEGARRDPVQVLLLPSHPLEGTVYSAGQPVPDAIVSARRLLSPGRFAVHELTSSSDAEGKYRIEGLSAGRWRLFVRLGTGMVRAGGFVEIPQVTAWDIRLEGDATVQGRVVDGETGEPIAGAQVSLVIWASGDLEVAEASTESREDGSFSVGDLPPGILFSGRLRVRKEGYLNWPDHRTDHEAIRAELLPGAVVTREVRLHRGSAVRGTVRGSDGTPLSGAKVTLLGRYEGMTAATDDGGRFHIAPAAPGRAVLRVSAGGWVQPGMPVRYWEAMDKGECPAEWLVEIPVQGEAEKDLVLEAAASTAGLVLGADGQPAGGSLVYLHHANGQPGGSPSAVADEGGAFRIEDLDPKILWRAVAQAPGGRRGESAAFRAGEEDGPVRIVLSPGAAISGRVARRDGGSLGSVDLRLLEGAPDTRIPTRIAAKLVQARSVPVDRDGSFRVEGLLPAQYTFHATADGCAPALGPEVVIGAGEEKDGLAILLDPGSALEGIVQDDEGRPVVGAAISVSPLPEGPKVWFAGEAFHATAVTDERGRFHQRGIGAGNYSITVRARGFVETSVEARASVADLVVTLARGLEISGRIVETGTSIPVVGIPVRAQPTHYSPRFLVDHRATSGPDGRFVLTALIPGTYHLSIGGFGSSGETWVWKRTGPVEAGASGIRIELSRGLSIRGRVVNEKGEPLGRSVTIFAQGRTREGKPDRSRWGQARSDPADGTFSVNGILGGLYDLTVNPRYGGSTGVQTTLEAVEAGSEGAVIRLPSAAHVSGRVVTEDRSPLPNGSLEIVPTGGGASVSEGVVAFVRKDGTFRTPPLELGRRYDLRARHFAGFLDSRLRGVAPGEVDVVIVLRHAGRIVGRVVDLSGTPLPAGIPVRVEAENAPKGAAGPRAYAATDRDGGFVIEGLGNFRFRLTAGEGNSEFVPTSPKERFAAGAVDVTIRTRKGERLSGVLVNKEGDPKGGIEIHVTGVPGLAARTAPDGRFVMRGVPPGEIRLEARIGARKVNLGTHPSPSDGLRLRIPKD